jgi:mannose-6-phosphate isomerase-like protein (cupin superfamily)
VTTHSSSAPGVLGTCLMRAGGTRSSEFMSTQFYEHRSEHRFVIEGVATATIDDEVLLAAPDPSVDVPQGSAHRLANEGPRRLVVIEVRRGAYTGEDDMTRHEGNYGRCRPYEQIVDVADA